MGEQRRLIEEIAAEEIAADEERSRGWAMPKAVVGLPAALLPWWRQNVVIWAGGAGLILVLLIVGAIALAGGAPQATPIAGVTPSASASVTAGAVASPTATATATATDVVASPTTAPPATATPTVIPMATPVFGRSDPQGDALTDSGAEVPSDGVVDISGVLLSRAPDGRLDAQVMHVDPLPPSQDPNVSRAVNVLVGRSEQAPTGAIVAAQTRFVPLRGWFWQLHDGELTMGSFDDETRQGLPTAATIVHDLATGTFDFRIPAAELPEGTDFVWIVSFHRPTPADERRRDDAGPILLSDVGE